MKRITDRPVVTAGTSTRVTNRPESDFTRRSLEAADRSRDQRERDKRYGSRRRNPLGERLFDIDTGPLPVMIVRRQT